MASTSSASASDAVEGSASGNSSALPPPSSLVWSHATNSRAKLDAALSDPTITAIEADIMIRCCDDDDSNIIGGGDPIAIMSHPPFSHSDLSAERFLGRIFQDMAQRGMKRHIKLDFKEMDAIEPVLKLIAEHHTKGILEFQPTIYLNADILEGPGVRGPDAVTVRPEEFLSTCLKYIDSMISDGESSQTIRQYFAFSLGYKCNYKSRQPYTEQDACDMAKISQQHGLDSKCGGVVLALNARTLALGPGIFDDYFAKFPKSQILAWTGAGEEPIPQSTIEEIKEHFKTTGCLDRVGFDCAIV